MGFASHKIMSVLWASALLATASCSRVPGIANDGKPEDGKSSSGSADVTVETGTPGIAVDVPCNCQDLLEAEQRGDYQNLANIAADKQNRCTYTIAPEKLKNGRGRLSIEVEKIHSIADFKQAEKVAENAFTSIEHKANRPISGSGLLFQISGKNSLVGPLMITLTYLSNQKILIKTEEFKYVNSGEEDQPANFTKNDPNYLAPAIEHYPRACQ